MRRTIVNDPENVVPEALEGLVLSNPLMLALEDEHRYVTRRQRASDKVGLVSGGGSGHEPLHAGFVGTGMLDVAVAGAVFASPTALQVLEATKAADSGRGVVQIVKNYTGDVLNFRIAGEISGDDAIETEIVLVDDDLATDTGDGSGHEPLHAGFVGTGMLDVAVAGAVFASPTALQVLEATKAADSGRGVVQIVKNYTGDVLNFRIAGEISGDDQVDTEIVLVDDDLATDLGDESGPGRRGTAATVIVEKLCGGAAEAGASLAEVAAIGRRAAARARTMSLALSAGTHPGDTEPQFTLGEDEVELGVGIHGERGRDRVPFRDADGLVELLVEPLRKELDLHRGEEVLAIVNGLGGTYPLELQLAARSLHHHLADAGIAIERSLVGSYVTSLDMHGISITLMPLDDQQRSLWDAPVRTPALTW